jgi:hypothetical protein
MNHLFDHWEQVCTRLKAARKIGLFIDLEGVLVRQHSSIDEPVRESLEALSAHPRFRVTVIGESKREDVVSNVGIPAVQCVGLQAATLPESRHALTVVRGLLSDVLNFCPGMWLEEQRDRLTIHDLDRKADDVIRGIAGRFSKWVRLKRGNKAWELEPHEVEDKSEAVQRELKQMGWLALPVYVGSDAGTFESLYRGVTVGVGEESGASYGLADAGQVQVFLDRLRFEVA